MSQNDFSIANQGFPAFRSDLNNALQALATNSSGTTAPGTPYAFQWWYDTSDNALKIRNADNDAWITFATFNQTNNTWQPAGQNLSGRNIVVNGSGRINQRGYVSGTSTSDANQYTLDRWRVVTSGQNLSFTGDNSGRVMTAPSGGVEQVIEGANIQSGTYTLTYSGTATCTVGGVTRTSGSSFNLNGNSNVTVRFSSGTFSDVQIEPGDFSTPFEFINYADELHRCKRYYQKFSYRARWDSGGNFWADIRHLPLPVEMRTTPSASAINDPDLTNNIQSFSISAPDPRSYDVDIVCSVAGIVAWSGEFFFSAEF